MALKVLCDRILNDGKCLEGGILKVDRFINHQMDPYLMKQVAIEFIRRFADLDINKIITVEASGIAPAVMLGYLMGLPVVFVKKKIPKTVEEYWKSWVYSFTKGETTTVCVDRQFLTAHDRILFIDDFLADGHASGSIIHLCRQCGAQIVGMGFLVEKGFAQGGQFLRDHSIPYHALATITRINEDGSMDLQ